MFGLNCLFVHARVCVHACLHACVGNMYSMYVGPQLLCVVTCSPRNALDPVSDSCVAHDTCVTLLVCWYVSHLI